MPFSLCVVGETFMQIHNLLSSLSSLDLFVNSISNNWGIWYLILVNAFGVIAIILKTCEFQLKGRSKNILFCALAQTSWVLYFVFQADIASATSSLIGVMSCLVFLQREKYKWANSYFWLFFFIAIVVVNCIIGFDVWHDVFSILAAFLGVVAYFVINPKAYRYLALVVAISWLLNSTIKGYLLASICDIASTISVSVAIIRFYWIKGKSKNPSVEQEQKSPVETAE